MQQLAVILSLVAYTAAQAAEPLSYGRWLLAGGGFDWQTVFAYAATAFFGGAIRSIVTLMSAAPTYQVAMELLKDVVLSATLGLPTAMVLLYLVAEKPELVPGVEAQMVLLVAMGYMGGAVWKGLDATLKAALALATDGLLAALARRMNLPPPPPIVPDVAAALTISRPPQTPEGGTQ